MNIAAAFPKDKLSNQLQDVQLETIEFLVETPHWSPPAFSTSAVFTQEGSNRFLHAGVAPRLAFRAKS